MNTPKSIQTCLIVVVALAILGVGIFMNMKGSSPQSQNPMQPAVVEKKAESFKDGTYTAEGDYRSPVGPEHIKVELTIKAGVVTDSVVTAEANMPKSQHFQNLFVDGYKQLVVGKKISDLQLGKVAGSSLTPKGFNDAVTKIMTQAQS
jgi:uncharacterized protein with FMN-binding domain